VLLCHAVIGRRQPTSSLITTPQGIVIDHQPSPTTK
jgi:hypothetical protein